MHRTTGLEFSFPDWSELAPGRREPKQTATCSEPDTPWWAPWPQESGQPAKICRMTSISLSSLPDCLGMKPL